MAFNIGKSDFFSVCAVDSEIDQAFKKHFFAGFTFSNGFLVIVPDMAAHTDSI